MLPYHYVLVYITAAFIHINEPVDRVRNEGDVYGCWQTVRLCVTEGEMIIFLDGNWLENYISSPRSQALCVRPTLAING